MLLFVGTRSLGGSNSSRTQEDKTQYIPLKSLVKDAQVPSKAYSPKPFFVKDALPGVSTFDIEEPQATSKKTALQTFLGLFCCCTKKN